MNNREIEIKYSIENWKLDTLSKRIKSLPFLNIKRSLESAITKDFYFPASQTIQTIRLRDSCGVDGNGFSKLLKELTFKNKDQGNNFNRLEENIEIHDCLPAYRAMVLAFGEPSLIITKEERVYWTEELVISLATVNNSSTIYLEIEGPTEDSVLQTAKNFEEYFEMKKETRSLLEIYTK